MANRYRIAWQIGQGAMGAVYAAVDERLERLVAIKLLLASYVQHPESLERFAREATATASITHPGIVQVFDRGRDGDLVFVVMERLTGEDLAELLDRSAPLPVEQCLALAAELADAVAAAHSLAIVHRDLKPSNVFVVRGGDQPRIKVLDFGIAKLLASEHALTRASQVLGTLEYMSPEQLRSSKGVSGATDVYAMGAIMHEMLLGQPPFGGGSRAELSYRILNDTPLPLRARRPNVPEALDRLVRRCLDKRSEVRPSAEDLTGLLRAMGAQPAPKRAVMVLPPPLVVGTLGSRHPGPAATALSLADTAEVEQPRRPKPA